METERNGDLNELLAKLLPLENALLSENPEDPVNRIDPLCQASLIDDCARACQKLHKHLSQEIEKIKGESL